MQQESAFLKINNNIVSSRPFSGIVQHTGGRPVVLISYYFIPPSEQL